MHLLYLHGFRSSPASFKAQRLAAWLQQHRPDVHWCCPQLPPSPAQAWRLINAAVAGWPRETMAVVGSSLGGFYATALAEATGCRAVVLNPAVDPARDLSAYIGEVSAYHDPATRWHFKPAYIQELQALQVGALTQPQRYAALIAQGDELLSWREMLGRYSRPPGAQLRLLPGSDHALSDFETHLPFVTGFLGLAPHSGAA